MEITAALAQTVAPNQDVLFTETPVQGNCSILHRDGAGLVTLRGNTNQCFARYQVDYSGNIAVPATGTAGEISLAIAIDGEPLATATGAATPTVTEAYFNVAMHAQIAAPRGCCVECSVQNNSAQAIDVRNSNLTVTRIA